MINYRDETNKFITFYKEKDVSLKEIEVLTNALIGAISYGNEVKTLNYSKEDMKNINLDKYKKFFKQTGKTVEELEKFLSITYEKYNLSLFDLNNQIEILADLYKKEPDRFLSKFVFIPNDIIILKGNTFNQDIKAIIEEDISDNLKYSILNNDDGIFIYTQKNNKMLKLKKYFSDVKFNFNINDFHLNEKNKEYIGFLYF